MTQVTIEDYLRDNPRYDGDVYSRERDDVRLNGQIKRVFDELNKRQWRTLYDLSNTTGDPEASISAQLRHLRKQRFGAWEIEKRLREGCSGLWEYRMTGRRLLVEGVVK